MCTTQVGTIPALSTLGNAQLMAVCSVAQHGSEMTVLDVGCQHLNQKLPFLHHSPSVWHIKPFQYLISTADLAKEKGILYTSLHVWKAVTFSLYASRSRSHTIVRLFLFMKLAPHFSDALSSPHRKPLPSATSYLWFHRSVSLSSCFTSYLPIPTHPQLQGFRFWSSKCLMCSTACESPLLLMQSPNALQHTGGLLRCDTAVDLGKQDDLYLNKIVYYWQDYSGILASTLVWEHVKTKAIRKWCSCHVLTHMACSSVAWPWYKSSKAAYDYTHRLNSCIGRHPEPQTNWWRKCQIICGLYSSCRLPA